MPRGPCRMGCEGPGVEFLKCKACPIGFRATACRRIRKAHNLKRVARPGLQYSPYEVQERRRQRKALL